MEPKPEAQQPVAAPANRGALLKLSAITLVICLCTASGVTVRASQAPFTRDPFIFNFPRRLPFMNDRYACNGLNPSFAGITGGLRVQSSSIHGSRPFTHIFTGTALSADLYLPRLKAGVYLSGRGYTAKPPQNNFFFAENFRAAEVEAGYAQHISPGSGKIRLTPSAGLAYNNLRSEFSPFSPLIDPSLNEQATHIFTAHQVSGRVGMLMQIEHIYLGFAAGVRLYHSVFSFDPSVQDLTVNVSWNMIRARNLRWHLNAALTYERYYSNVRLANTLLLFRRVIAETGFASQGYFGGVGYRHRTFSLTARHNFGYKRIDEPGYWELGLSCVFNKSQPKHLVPDLERW